MEIIHLILLLILCDILQCSGVHRSSSQLLLRQKRNWIIDSFTIDEGYQGPFPYLLGKIDIEKDLVLFKIRGQGVDLEPKKVLEINEYTGQITVLRPVDSEEYSTLKLTFQALDRQNHEIDTQLGIHIQILDSNDNPPIFKLEKYNISIKESTLQGTVVVTIEATDKDRSEKNNKCSLKIISVTPTPKDLEFYLEQIHEQGIGTISFKGCLDHETAQKYTIIVEAKDNGEKPLSSSCTITINIEDGNNHLPVITQQIGPEKVKEGQSNVLVSRIQVNDEDTRGTPAWRAKYTIQGDTNNNFRITTDPETNEGLVYVEKPLNYEDGKMKNITITVENEIPYYSCKVERRSTTGLWKVVTKSGSTATGTTVSSVTGTELATGASSHQVIVTVEDVNEPPVFDKPSKEVVVTEYFGVGKYLETFTAKDPDVAKANKFKYTIGHDPAGWITVDPDTGNVTTSKFLDRESEFVKDNIYVVTICAVDDGIPKTTSTATLSIHVRDENDHAPSLVLSIIEMCQSDDHSFANITALDADDEPYGGPFTFKLLGDVAGKWEVDPVVGYSVNLIKDHTVHSEHHELLLEVSDKQGNTAVHNLSVTVCSCLHSNIPNCHMRKSGAALGVGAVGIFLFGMLLIAGLLLLTLLMSCKKEILEIHGDFFSEQLMKSNTENPGTDCPVATVMQNQRQMQETSQVKAVTMNSMLMSGQDLQSATKYSTACGNFEEYGTFENGILGQQQVANKNLHWLTNDSANNRSQTNSEFFKYQRKTSMAQPSIRGNFMRMSLRGSNMEMRYLQGQSKNELINEAVHGGSQTNSLISELQKEDAMSEFIRGNFMRMSLGASSNTGMRHLGGQSKHGFMNEAVHGASQTKSLISEFQREGSVVQEFTRGSYTRKSLGASSEMGLTHLQRKSKHAKWRGHSLTFLENLLNEQIPKMMATLQEPGKELGNYEPHVYAEEGDADHNFKLDAISIPDVSFDPEMDLDIKFSTLASICMPSDIATVHNIQTSTLVQGESH